MSEKIENLNIPGNEKENLSRFIDLLYKSANELNYDLMVDVVGGVISKLWPRKDIDLICSIPNLIDREYASSLDKANTTFEALNEIVSQVTETGDFKIIDKIKPYLDHQHEDNPNRVAHNGSVTVKPKSGTQIEIINNV